MIKLIIPFISLIISIFISTYLICNSKRNNLQNRYLILSFALIGWIFFYLFLRLFVIPQNMPVFFKFGSVFWLWVGIGVYDFSHAVIVRKTGFLKKILYLLYFFGVFTGLFTDKITQSWYYNANNELTIQFGSQYVFYMIFLIISPVLYSVFLLIKNLKPEKDLFIKIQSVYFLTGAFLIVAVSLFTDTIIPYLIGDMRNLADKTMIYILIYNIYILVIMLKYGFLSRQSDIYYYSIFNLIEDPVIIVDEDGNIIRNNTSFEKTFPFRVFHENIYDFFNINTKLNYSEFSYNEKLFKLNIIDIETSSHSSVLKMIIFKDISFYRELFINIPENTDFNLSRILYEIIFKAENFPVVIFEKKTGRIINSNPSFSIVTGIAHIGADKFNFSEFLNDIEDFEKISTNLDSMDEFSANFYIKDNNSNIIFSEISFSLFGEKKQFVIAVFREESRILNLEREILKNERISELSMITGGISHEYNNYNTIISGYIEIITRISSNGIVDEEIKKIDILVEKMTRLVFSMRLVFGKEGTVKEIIDIKEIFDLVRDILKSEFKNNDILLECKIDKNNYIFIEKNIFSIILISVFDILIDSKLQRTTKKISVYCKNENSMKVLDFEIVNFVFEENINISVRYDYLRNILKRLGGMIIFREEYEKKNILIKVPLYI